MRERARLIDLRGMGRDEVGRDLPDRIADCDVILGQLETIEVSPGAHASGFRLDADDERIALPSTAAEGGRADPTASAPQFEREGEDDAGPAHADRVAERDSSAIDVRDVCRDAELGRGRQGNARERLVDLEQVDVVEGERSFLTTERFTLQCIAPQGVANGPGRLDDE